MMRRAVLILALMAVALTACDTPSWIGGGPKKIKRTPGDRIDVIVERPQLTADADVAAVPVEVPDQAPLADWTSRNDAMLTPHIGITGLEHEEDAAIGEGNPFTRDQVPPPIVVNKLVVAMDAAGYVTAHDADDIGAVKWKNTDITTPNDEDMLGGGLAVNDGTVYAATGYGKLAALDLATGKKKWVINVGAPVRGAPAIAADAHRVIVLTADNQTLAFDTDTGEPRWEHRGIRESAGYFSMTGPVVSEGIVVAAYSSGELFAIRAETGSVLWNDTISSPVKTSASAVFSGIDADPIVQDGVVVVTSASGQMQASALLNGRPLWQAKIGAHVTPWSAGNAIFVLSDTHDLAAVLKRDGKVRWSQSLLQRDDMLKDVTPPLFGPILAGNAIVIATGDGHLITYRPQDGQRLGTYDVAAGIASNPVAAGGALYFISKDAKLHKYY